MPVNSDMLIIDNKGTEITSMDFLIMEIGILSTPGALPSLKLFVIKRSSSEVTGAKFVNKLDGVLLIKSLKDFDGGEILLAKLGPIFVKY